MDHNSPSSPSQRNSLGTNLDHIIKGFDQGNPQNSFSSPGQHSSDASILNFVDIISDFNTLEFLSKHFPGCHVDKINIESFLDVLLLEFFLRNPTFANDLEDTEAFRGELRELLRHSLVRNHSEMLSLDALEACTKKKGLYDFVYDSATEAHGISKSKKIAQSNPEAYDALLEAKRVELVAYESRLKEYERSLLERENQMKMIIQAEYERLLKSFDESHGSKVNNIQKRLLTHEKSTKLKIKQFEIHVKEIKAHSVRTSGSGMTDDKSQYKISSLEKSNEFLMHKIHEIEKRLLTEQESRQNLGQKNQRLTNKIALLEKSLKDSQGSISLVEGETEVLQVSKSENKVPGVIEFSTAEINEDNFEEGKQRGRSASAEEEEGVENNGNILLKKKKGVLKKTKDDISPIGGGVKKKTTTVKAAPTSEFKVLLNVVHSLIVCLKSTLPVFMQDGGDKKNEEEKIPVDLGEVFYPSFDHLVGNLTELLPIIGKQYDSKYVASIVEVYYKLINFFFKFKIQRRFENITAENRLLSEYEIQNSSDKIKTMQDHVNEIMVASGQGPREIAELNFNPQTEYWKKLMKLAKPLQSQNALDNKENKAKLVSKPDYMIKLFSEDIVQKEILTIFKRFLDSTEFMLKGAEKETNPNVISVVSFHTQLNLETQKYLQITRLYSALTSILLAKSKREQILGLQSLMVDLNVENAKIAEFLRLFFVENDGLNILFWVLENNMSEVDVIQFAADVLVSLNCSGAHYSSFVETISKQENIQVILDLLVKYGARNELCEKLSVIIQRIIHHNTLQGNIPEKYISFFKTKLTDLEASQQNQPLTENLKSILTSLNVV